MNRVAASKDNLKPFFHKHQLGMVTQSKVAEELGISKQYISRIFREFQTALDEVTRDNRGRPRTSNQSPGELEEKGCSDLGGSTFEAPESESVRILKLQSFLLQTLVEFLLLWIGHFTRQLGINYSPFTSRLPGEIKLFLVQSLIKYQEMGGKLAEFALRLKRDPSTFYRWLNLYSTGQSLDDKPSGCKRPPQVYPDWVLRAIHKLRKKYPMAEAAGLAQLFNSSISNPGLKISVQEIKRILSQIEEKRHLDHNRRKKRFDFPQVNLSWDLDFLEFTLNGIRRKALIIMDHHSRRLLYARIMVKPTANRVAEIIKALTQHHKAVPLFVKADNGPEFREQFKQLLVDLKINLLNSPRYYPQFNGVVERINREIGRKSIAFDLNNIQAVNKFLDEFLVYHNYSSREFLGGLSPNQVYTAGFHANHPETTEIVIPYQKNGELRIKFTRRNGNQGRLAFPLL